MPPEMKQLRDQAFHYCKVFVDTYTYKIRVIITLRVVVGPKGDAKHKMLSSRLELKKYLFFSSLWMELLL